MVHFWEQQMKLYDSMLVISLCMNVSPHPYPIVSSDRYTYITWLIMTKNRDLLSYLFEVFHLSTRRRRKMGTVNQAITRASIGLKKKSFQMLLRDRNSRWYLDVIFSSVSGRLNEGGKDEQSVCTIRVSLVSLTTRVTQLVHRWKVVKVLSSSDRYGRWNHSQKMLSISPLFFIVAPSDTSSASFQLMGYIEKLSGRREKQAITECMEKGDAKNYSLYLCDESSEAGMIPAIARAP